MRRLGQTVPILVVLVLAFVVRIWGVKYCLPYGFGHIDEETVIRDAMQMGASKSLRPAFFDYPAFYTYLSLIGVGIKFAIGKLIGTYSSPNDLALEWAFGQGYIHLVGRLISVIAGTLTVGMTYLLGRRVADMSVGLGAAVIMAFAIEHVTQSHWALPDVTMAFLFTLALYFAYRLVQTGSTTMYVAAGIVGGLAFSTKYNAGPIVPVLLMAHILRVRSQGPKSVASYMDRRLLAGAFCLALGFVIGSPYWLLEPKPYIQAMQWNQSHMKVGHLGGSEGVRWLWVPQWLLRTEGALGALMLIGVVYGLVSRKMENTLLLSAVLLAFVITGSALKTSLYFMLPIYPAMAILGAQVLWKIAEKMRIPGRYVALIPAMALMVSMPQLISDVRMDMRMTVPDTRFIARDWIERNIPSRTMIAMEEPRDYCAPLLADNFVQHWSKLCPGAVPQLKERAEEHPQYRIINVKTAELTGVGDRPADYLAWYNERKWFTIDELRKKGVSYVILSSFRYERYWKSAPPAQGNPLRPVFFREKAAYTKLMTSPALRLVKTITPTSRNLGPTVLIYRMKANSKFEARNSKQTDQ